MNKNKLSGVWININLFDIEGLNLSDIVVLSVIVEMNKNGNTCYVSNGYLADLIKTCNDTARKKIRKLEGLNFIKSVENFNYPTNRLLFVTDHLNSLLNSSKGLRNSSRGLRKNTRGTLLNSSTNNIDDNIYINTTTTEKLRSNFILIDNLCEEYKLKKDFVLNFIDEFVKRNEEEQKVWDDNTDLFKHFKSSLVIKLKKKEVKFKLDKEVNWFIDRFNDISKKEFKVTPTIKKLFAKQFAVGYTGEQMCIAVKNMYSNSEENKFHINSSFKFATPEYLLKDENVNRYLNVGWSNNRDWKNATVKRKRLNEGMGKNP